MIPTEDIISIVKNTITASIKCNTHRGYIGWSSCDNICMDMHDCLDMCAETLEMRGYMVALEAATYILVSGVKLASHLPLFTFKNHIELICRINSIMIPFLF